MTPIVRLLLAANADIDARYAGSGFTAFHVSCFTGHPDCAEALVVAGCDAGLRDECGHTGWDLAELRGHSAVLERLAALKKAKKARKKREQRRRKKEEQN